MATPQTVNRCQPPPDRARTAMPIWARCGRGVFGVRCRLIGYPPWRCGQFVPSRHPDVWLPSRLPVVRDLASERGASVGVSPWCGSKEARVPNPEIRHAHLGPYICGRKGAGMAVMIGVDPHKGSHTAVVLDTSEQFLGELRGAVRGQSGRAADGLGRPVQGADVGDRGCWWTRLFVGSAARRCR